MSSWSRAAGSPAARRSHGSAGPCSVGAEAVASERVARGQAAPRGGRGGHREAPSGRAVGRVRDRRSSAAAAMRRRRASTAARATSPARPAAARRAPAPRPRRASPPRRPAAASPRAARASRQPSSGSAPARRTVRAEEVAARRRRPARSACARRVVVVPVDDQLRRTEPPGSAACARAALHQRVASPRARSGRSRATTSSRAGSASTVLAAGADRVEPRPAVDDDQVVPGVKCRDAAEQRAPLGRRSTTAGAADCRGAAGDERQRRAHRRRERARRRAPARRSAIASARRRRRADSAAARRARRRRRAARGAPRPRRRARGARRRRDVPLPPLPLPTTSTLRAGGRAPRPRARRRSDERAARVELRARRRIARGSVLARGRAPSACSMRGTPGARSVGIAWPSATQRTGRSSARREVGDAGLVGHLVELREQQVRRVGRRAASRSDLGATSGRIVAGITRCTSSGASASSSARHCGVASAARGLRPGVSTMTTSQSREALQRRRRRRARRTRPRAGGRRRSAYCSSCSTRADAVRVERDEARPCDRRTRRGCTASLAAVVVLPAPVGPTSASTNGARSRPRGPRSRCRAATVRRHRPASSRARNRSTSAPAAATTSTSVRAARAHASRAEHEHVVAERARWRASLEDAARGRQPRKRAQAACGISQVATLLQRDGRRQLGERDDGQRRAAPARSGGARRRAATAA